MQLHNSWLYFYEPLIALPHIIFSSLHFILKHWHVGKACTSCFSHSNSSHMEGRDRGACHCHIDRSQHFTSLLLPQKERSCHIHFNLQQVTNYVKVSVRSCSVSSFFSMVALRHRQKIRKTKHPAMVCVQLLSFSNGLASQGYAAVGFFFPQRTKH